MTYRAIRSRNGTSRLRNALRRGAAELGSLWAYVALRCAHTAVHLTSNRVPLRFRIYFASNFALLALWVALFAKLLRAG